MNNLSRSAFLAAVFGLASCGGGSPSPTAPTVQINLTGTWVESNGSEPTIVLTQTGSSIAGTVLVSPVAGMTVVTNAISGSVSGNAVTMTWTFVGRETREAATLTASVTFVFSLVATSSTAMSGTAAATVTGICTGSESCPSPLNETSNEVVSFTKQ